MKKNLPYIKRFSLKGYKSVKDVSGQFEKGLNIIIGNNGTGKTNLFDFFERVLLKDYYGLDVFSATISIINEFNKEHKRSVRSIVNDKIDVEGEGKTIKESGSTISPVIAYVKFNLPKDLFLFDKEYNAKYSPVDERFIMGEEKGELLFGLKFWLRVSFKNGFLTIVEDFEKLTERQLYKNLQEDFESTFSGVKKDLIYYTPVEDVRLSNTIRITRIDSTTYEFKNLVFEYKVSNEWFSWNALSDGTRRLIYIIFSISGISIPFPIPYFPNGIDATPIVFIEEPEIGIHPHQLHLLLTCLKERSEHQQIIISTHSPQVLDVLGEEDLHRIFITEIDQEKGTSIRKLNQHEIVKAKKYFQSEGLLSDYWRFSDFQRSKVSM